MKITNRQQLYMELSTLEDQGITIWLEGYPSNSMHVAGQLLVCDENSYMRDYIFDEGRLKEIHFNKIEKDE